MSTLIVFGIFVLAAFYSGFYCGYLKREEKPPELQMPLPPAVKAMVAAARKTEKEEPKSFFE